MHEFDLHGDDPLHASYYHGNYDPTHGEFPLSDEMIRDARPFEGWGPEFLGWPESLWKDPANHVPCRDPEKDAYHVRRLAEAMLDAGGWIGRYDPSVTDGEIAGALVVNYGTREVFSGSHRLRAWRYLIVTQGALRDIAIPLASDRARSAARLWADAGGQR